MEDLQCGAAWCNADGAQSINTIESDIASNVTRLGTQDSDAGSMFTLLAVFLASSGTEARKLLQRGCSMLPGSFPQIKQCNDGCMKMGQLSGVSAVWHV